MKALLFPGQGSQKTGMAKEFFDNFSLVKDIFSRADKALNFKISDIILSGTDEDLKKTEITQPAILTTSFSIFSTLKKEFNFDFTNINFYAGHSLGEYSALLAADSLSFEDAIKLVHKRGKLMQEAVPIGKGAMLAAMGIDISELNSVIKSIKKDKGVCEIANDNSIGQIIVSGTKESITELNNMLKEKKKRSIFLPVSAPFHCQLMKPAAEEMKKFLVNFDIKKPSLKIISNVNAKPYDNNEIIKDLLYKQIFSQVKWRETLEYMINQGTKEFIEIGPGKVLSGLVKRTSDKVKISNINTIVDIKNLK